MGAKLETASIEMRIEQSRCKTHDLWRHAAIRMSHTGTEVLVFRMYKLPGWTCNNARSHKK